MGYSSPVDRSNTRQLSSQAPGPAAAPDVHQLRDAVSRQVGQGQRGTPLCAALGQRKDWHVEVKAPPLEQDLRRKGVPLPRAESDQHLHPLLLVGKAVADLSSPLPPGNREGASSFPVVGLKPLFQGQHLPGSRVRSRQFQRASAALCRGRRTAYQSPGQEDQDGGRGQQQASPPLWRGVHDGPKPEKDPSPVPSKAGSQTGPPPFSGGHLVQDRPAVGRRASWSRPASRSSSQHSSMSRRAVRTMFHTSGLNQWMHRTQVSRSR